MTSSGRAMNGMPGWLRWIAVLPCALGSFLVVQIAVAVAHGFLELVGGLSPIVSMMGDYFPQLCNSAAGPYALVWAGSRVAPTHKAVTAATLAVMVAIMAAAGLILAVVNPQLTQRPGGMLWLIVTGVVSVGAAIK